METTPLITPPVHGVLPRVHRCITVEPVQFLYWLYMSASIPLISQFVHHQVEKKYNASHISLPCSDRIRNSSDYELADRIQSDASNWLLYLNLCAMIPGLLSTVILSAYSEHRGRKFVMMLPLIGAFLRVVTCFVVFIIDLPIAVLIVGAVLDGMLGMSCTMLMLCFSYLADITDRSQRSLRVVLLELCAGLAFIVSNLGIGYAIFYLGYTWTFAIIIGIIVLNFVYVACFLEESLVLETSIQGLSERGSHVVGARQSYSRSIFQPFLLMVRLYMTEGRYKRLWELRLTAVILGVVSIVQLGRMPVQTLFMLAYPLCCNSVVIGYFYSCSYLVTNFTNVIMTKLFAGKLGDLGLMFIGCLFGITFQLVFGFSFNILMLFMGRFLRF